MGKMGYLWSRTMQTFRISLLLSVRRVCEFLRFLTKLVTNCGGLGRVGGFTDTCRVAAADTEAVGLSFCEIK